MPWTPASRPRDLLPDSPKESFVVEADFLCPGCLQSPHIVRGAISAWQAHTPPHSLPSAAIPPPNPTRFSPKFLLRSPTARFRGRVQGRPHPPSNASQGTPWRYIASQSFKQTLFQPQQTPCKEDCLFCEQKRGFQTSPPRPPGGRGGGETN